MTSLVYETPACLRCADSEVLQLFHRAQQESYGNAFGSRNMLMYIVLQIHMLFCRYALQESMEEEQSPVWKLIKRTIVASQEHTTLQDAAAKLQLHPRYLNQKIKDACGYSFTQLRSFGKIINACALLHFEDLSISYIVDLLSYSSYCWLLPSVSGMDRNVTTGLPEAPDSGQCSFLLPQGFVFADYAIPLSAFFTGHYA